MISRAKLRGYKLDEDCKRANTTTHEYGLEDDRVFCRGLYIKVLSNSTKKHLN